MLRDQNQHDYYLQPKGNFYELSNKRDTTVEILLFIQRPSLILVYLTNNGK